MTIKKFKQKVIKFFTFKGFKVSKEVSYMLRQRVYDYLKDIDNNTSIHFLLLLGISNIKIRKLFNRIITIEIVLDNPGLLIGLRCKTLNELHDYLNKDISHKYKLILTKSTIWDKTYNK